MADEVGEFSVFVHTPSEKLRAECGYGGYIEEITQDFICSKNIFSYDFSTATEML